MEATIGINQRIPMQSLELALKAVLDGQYDETYATELARMEYKGDNRIKKTFIIFNKLTRLNPLMPYLLENADKVKLTGKKMTNKVYYRHTGWIGGIKETTPAKILAGKFPGRVIEKAVERMISRNPLGRQQMTKLKVYAGENHPHAAQNPIVLDLAAKNPKNKRSAL